MIAAHTDRVHTVAAQLAARPAGVPVTIRKATPSHTVRDTGYKAACHAVDVSGLREILEIDAPNRLATAEGQVLMGDLARATLAHGLLPAVVPEFRQFTVAGLVNGEGLQSSSHRHGAFTHTLTSVEVLLADGTIAQTSRDHHADLFAALPESLGTLGIVTAATIRLVPAAPYVKVTCRRFRALSEYLDAFRESLERHAFHEGVVFGPRMYVLLTGDFADGPGATPVFRPDEIGAPYFYQRMRASAAARPVTEHAIETLAYLSRSERGLWWLMECHADFPLLSETTWGRRHMDNAAHAAYNKTGFASRDLTGAERDRCLISQDMGMTLERLGNGIEWVQQRLGVYPIWNCAIRLPDDMVARLRTTHLVDIGIYGEPMVRGYRHVRDMRALQLMVDLPALWGTSYLTWDEIRATAPERYDRYEQARVRYKAAGAFMDLKDKVVWVDPAQADLGKIPMWRLRRTFGPRWYTNPVVYPLLAAVYLSKLLWRPPSAG